MLDTNILLLFFVGIYDEELITKFKRTQVFAKEDYQTLLNFLNYFDKIATTPNILTEVSNLLGQLSENIKSVMFSIFGRVVMSLQEDYVRSVDIIAVPGFQKFGLTDTSILHESNSKYLVLTDDFRLSQYLQTNGRDVVNFNHIRTANWK